jgi:hypothetical protein
MLTIRRPAADRAGARPTVASASSNQFAKPAGRLAELLLYDRAAAPIQDLLVQLASFWTAVMGSNGDMGRNRDRLISMRFK